MHSRVGIHSDGLRGPARPHTQAQIELGFLAIFYIQKKDHRMAAELSSQEYPNLMAGNRKAQCDKLPAHVHTMDRDAISQTANRNTADHREYQSRSHRKAD